MKLPRTMTEALKQGYLPTGGHSDHSEDELTATGYCTLLKDGGEPELTVPYTATFKFGRPKRFILKRRSGHGRQDA